MTSEQTTRTKNVYSYDNNCMHEMLGWDIHVPELDGWGIPELDGWDIPVTKIV